MTRRGWIGASITAAALAGLLLLCMNLSGCFSALPGGRYFMVEARQGGHLLAWQNQDVTYVEFDRITSNVTASGGCNTLSAKVKLNHGHLIVHEVGTTLGGCAGPLEAQNHWVEQLLLADPHMDRQGNQLTLTADNGYQMVFRK